MKQNSLVVHKKDIIKHVVGAWCIVFDVLGNIESVNQDSADFLHELFGHKCFVAEFSALVFSNKDEVYAWIKQNKHKIPFNVTIYNPDGGCWDEFTK